MAELKTRVNDASVEKFLAKQTDPQVRADCRTLIELMAKASGAPPKMWGSSIVGFGHWHYVYESGREGDCCQAGFSPRKAAITLYLMATFPGREALLSTLGKHKTGVGCLYVKRLEDVHMPTLRTLIQKSFQAAKVHTAEHARKAEAKAAAKEQAVRTVVTAAARRKAGTKTTVAKPKSKAPKRAAASRKKAAAPKRK
jgi:hypothetical protein